MRKLFSAFVILITFSHAEAQENCGNGTDDDGDGLVDCKDADCISNVVPTGTYFNTATNRTGGTLTGGSNDLNWKIATSFTGPYTPAIVMGSIPGNYYNSPWPDCHWISHVADGTHNVNMIYYYKITFNLPCENSCGNRYSDSGTFCLFMDFFADNSVDEVYINGIPQSAFIPGVPAVNPYYYQGYSAANRLSLSLCNDWKPGTNELVLKITSGPGYAGFLAQNSTMSTNSGDPTISLPAGRGPSMCITEAPLPLIGASPGGKWSATCGNCIDSVSGVFDPAKASPGKHIITYKVIPACPISDTIELEITEPGITIVPVIPVCRNRAPFELKASKSGGIWSGPGITDPQNGIFDPSLVAPGVHQVKYVVTGICGGSDSLNITIREVTADAIASANDTICPGGIATLNVQGGPPYLWSTGDTAANIMVTPSITTLYTVKVTNDTCDSDPDSVYVIVLSPPNASFTPDATAGLSPFLVRFTNNSSGAVSYF